MRIFAPMNSLITPQNFYEAIAGPVVYNDDSPYRLMMKRIDDIDTIYFQEGKKTVAEEISNRLSPAIKTVILKDLSAFGEELICQLDKVQTRILSDVDSLVKQYSSPDRARRDLSAALIMIHDMARKQLPLFVHSKYYCQYKSRDIKRLHEAAMRVTLLERLTGSNDKDVIEYYHAIIYHTAFACYKLTRRKASQFLLHMVDIVSREYDLQSPVATIYNDPPSTTDVAAQLTCAL